MCAWWPRWLLVPTVCQFVCFAGSTFNAEELSSLQIGDMKTKMLLGALTKLGKLHVQVDNGQIIGYRMDW